jgi:non-specific serine/threonine protein kinase
VSASGGILAHESGLLVLDLSRRELRASGVSVPIGGRAFEILAILVQSAEDLVSKDELIRRVWPGAVVQENTLQAQIAAIRKALRADRDSLKTVSGRGYRLVGKWTQRAAAGPTQSPSSGPEFHGQRRVAHESAGQPD